MARRRRERDLHGYRVEEPSANVRVAREKRLKQVTCHAPGYRRK